MSPLLFEADSIWFQHSYNYELINAAYHSQDLNYINVNELIKQSQLVDTNLNLDEDGSLTLERLFELCKDENKKRIINKYLKAILKKNNAKLSSSEYDSNLNYDFSHAPWTLPSYDYVNLINQYMIFNMLKNGKRSGKKNEDINISKKGSWEKVNWDLFNNNNIKISNILFNNLVIDQFNEIKNKQKLYHSNIINIKQIREAEKLLGKTYNGLITSVQSYGFFVELPNLFVEGLVHVSTLNDDWYEYRSRQNLLVGRKSKNTFRVGDLIDIKILRVDILKYQIDLEIA